MSNFLEMKENEAAKTTCAIINNRQLEIRNAVLIWPDFAGEGKYAKGKRTFNIVCNTNMINEITGYLKWFNDNKKENKDVITSLTFHRKPIYTDDEIAEKNCQQADLVYITVKVNMNAKTIPTMFLYTTKADGTPARQKLDATTCGTIDRVDAEKVDIIVNLWCSPEFPDKMSAYLDTIHVTQSKQTPLFGGDYDDWDDNDENVFTTTDLIVNATENN